MTARLWAVAAVLFALVVTGGVGWSHYATLRPPSAGVATRDVPLTVGGVRYQVLDLQRLQRITFADHEPLVAPEGAVWVRLDVRLELLDAGIEMDTLRCTGFLVSGGSEWSDDYDPASYSDDLASRQCHTVGDDRPLTVGVPKTLTLHWLVPTWAAEQPQFFLRFVTPPRGLELRP
ncbi:hypothetical protein [Micropruina sp.]|uniref:hypothetical protein n=1 Tax=Micropruina sp. TaxID=2737536 RepID=UPI0039E5A2D3